ncbi:hypothetical protein TSUD_53310 [Trifolium subterraneum]|uniref:Uncharacterized protein n=1 Tax=Trifolium subterraneum TaxID=3900 RepID=A0A2Z6NDC8_TRISU|nr:hypothetical protein TSUD_53310 [Trifolium subterraneum]
MSAAIAEPATHASRARREPIQQKQHVDCTPVVAGMLHRANGNQGWKNISHDIAASASTCHDLHLPPLTLSDVDFSPQSNLRYPLALSPVSALLPVKAVTGTAALVLP